MSCRTRISSRFQHTRVRSCFRAPAGRKLVIADYSQIDCEYWPTGRKTTALVKALLSVDSLRNRQSDVLASDSDQRPNAAQLR